MICTVFTLANMNMEVLFLQSVTVGCNEIQAVMPQVYDGPLGNFFLSGGSCHCKKDYIVRHGGGCMISITYCM
jgi:hypothetical protein